MNETTPQAESQKSVNVVALAGRLGITVEDDLAATLTKAIEASSGSILIDMAKVEFVSSSGLRAMMMAYRQATAAGKKMAMAHVQPGVYKIFKLTALEGMLHVFDDRDRAMAWLSE